MQDIKSWAADRGHDNKIIEKACQFLVSEGIFVERTQTSEAFEVAPGPIKLAQRKPAKIERIAIKDKHMDKIILQSGTISPTKQFKIKNGIAQHIVSSNPKRPRQAIAVGQPYIAFKN